MSLRGSQAQWLRGLAIVLVSLALAGAPAPASAASRSLLSARALLQSNGSAVTDVTAPVANTTATANATLPANGTANGTMNGTTNSTTLPPYPAPAPSPPRPETAKEKLEEKWKNIGAGKSSAEKGIAITIGVIMLVGMLTCLVCCVFRRGGQWRVPGLQWFRNKFMKPKDKYSRYMDSTQDDGF
ncbi:hypothetical protein CHLRE_16g682650v5 [Chlamydomonas reinhardtii]|uniref:Uncharacterized protein n=1 Tax=Chlamydomonas reinhardtii TaxID=3055 RepID=A0A2K3CUY6_CHLRE|nr:uncharacterized protein CHLRE_16g682650v5 [Chlamydomonas reinhardtii]PNW72093.1 hypothetical protein CHLRE_16g682650v5 [Chlamydomonas reinhardtii]